VTDNRVAAAAEVPRPYTLVAELTYRCPLRCAYCSNPVHLDAMGAEMDTTAWARVFKEAEALGVMQVTLTGGEPLLRPDLAELVRAARDSDLFATLITSGIPADRDALARLRDAGLEGVQLSFQDVDGGAASRIAGVDKLARKQEVAGFVRDLGLPLTLNIVLHRDAGEGRMEAIHNALKEIIVPLVGSTVTPVVVFLPLISITGVTGTFFRALAVTMSVSLFTSLGLALVWTPNLALYFVRRKDRDEPAQAPLNEPAKDGGSPVVDDAEEMRRLMAAEETSMTGFFGKVIRFYERWLRRALDRPGWRSV